MERVGKYVIHKRAVTTGYAQVLFCHDPDLMVPVAIKLFDPFRLAGGALSPPQLLDRFVAEARALAAFDHPHIIGVKNFDCLSDGRPFFVMPYQPAKLSYEIGRDDAAQESESGSRRLSVARAVTVLRQLAVALAVLHRRGMAHRQVQPSNILLTAREGGTVKLADLSRVRLSAKNPPMPGQWGLSPYAAPEMLGGSAEAGAEADVYSLGLLAYRMVTGLVPDRSNGLLHLAPGPWETGALAEFILRTTAEVPAERLPNGLAALQMLDGLTQDKAVRASRSATRPVVPAEQAVPAE